MSNDFNFPSVPDSDGDLQPYSPQTPLAPSPADQNLPDYWVSPAGESPQSRPHTLGGFFGQEVPGVSVHDLQQNLVIPVANLFRQEMQNRNVPSRYIEAAANWFIANCQKVPRPESKYHDYDLRGFTIAPEDKAPLTAFLNHLDESGVPGHIVRLFLSWYWNALPRILEQHIQGQSRQSSSFTGGVSLDSLSEADVKFVLKCQPKHQQATKDHLKNLWGDSYFHRMQIAAGYFNQLPEADRAFFESTVCGGWVLLGDSVEAITWAYNQAVAQAKPAVNVESLKGEIEAIEKVMAEDRKRYNNDIGMQERLRLLYQARDGG